MKRIAWLTDIHLNFLSPDEVHEFLETVALQNPDAIFLGGDIGEAPTVVSYLKAVAQRIPKPIYFILGNHDFYHGSIAGVSLAVEELCRRTPLLCRLSDADVVELTHDVGLIGHDGWADGRLGDYARSDVVLNDYLCINEFIGLGVTARLQLMQRLAARAAQHVARVLPLAFAKYRNVMLLTHVPPFRQAAWHQGHICTDDWLPHFSCKAVGDAIFDFMKKRPDCHLTILCGHTHSSGEAQILPNVTAITGDARYGRPKVNRLFTFE